LKIKTVRKGKFPVVGFVKDPTGVAALYLGRREGKDLVYMGKVGTGWNRTTSSQIRKQLDTVISPKSKLTKAFKKPKATWVEPEFFAALNTVTSYRKGCYGAGGQGPRGDSSALVGMTLLLYNHTAFASVKGPGWIWCSPRRL
jgi:ATP dependent DNA ligase C terminal region